MKVIVVGGGIISKKLVSTAPSYIDVTFFGIRDLSNTTKSWTELNDKCKDADVIVYLAYHHRDFFKNLKLLYKLISSLNHIDWLGKLIFFNSQSAIADKILKVKGSQAVKIFFSFDLYTVTKRIQSWLLSRYSRKIFISEIYLPVVLGFETKAQKRFNGISRHRVIHLPKRGQNPFAYIELDLFLDWFWKVFLDKLKGNDIKHEYRKFFLYQGLRTFAEMINILYQSNMKSEGRITGQPKSLLFDDCVHRFRFSDKFFSNLIFYIKMSPVWMPLSIFRYQFSKLRSVNCDTEIIPDDSNFIEAPFSPVGAEYQYLSTSIDVDAIPFSKIRISA